MCVLQTVDNISAIRSLDG